jgi:hypothetical protein
MNVRIIWPGEQKTSRWPMGARDVPPIMDVERRDTSKATPFGAGKILFPAILARD